MHIHCFSAPRWLALLLLTFGAAQAQSLLYTGERFGTLDLFALEQGAERPLLRSDDRAEFDPSPSPDGELIGYAATGFVAGVTAPDGGWHWRYLLIDRAGVERWSWELPGSDGRFRPAGGFELMWLPDGRSFLAPAFGDDFVWEVRRYFVGASRTVTLGEGFGVVLAPDGERFAVTRDSGVVLVRIADGSEQPLGRGQALGWTPDGTGLLVERNAALLLVPVTAPARGVLIGDSGPYLGLSWSPDAEHYAVTILLEDGSAAFFYDREHTFLGSYQLPGLATALDWLDDERIVLEVAVGEGYAIVTMDLSGRTEELVPASGGGGLRRLGR